MPISVDEYKNKMENTLKIFHEELFRLRTGRATPSLLEPIFVEAYNSKKLISMSVCIPSEYVPKLSYPIKIHGNILFGINKKLILKIFS